MVRRWRNGDVSIQLTSDDAPMLAVHEEILTGWGDGSSYIRSTHPTLDEALAAADALVASGGLGQRRLRLIERGVVGRDGKLLR